MFTQLLHHTDAISTFDHEWGPRRTCWHGQNRNHEGPGASLGHHGIRVQLLRTDGLQVNWKYLQSGLSTWGIPSSTKTDFISCRFCFALP